ncbi:MAG: alpha/beta fold hydrolase [Hyphomicrobiales bacterium]|nr:MAG: alpha/beta fold hydrolase [Hyphomicrobiales bacterium]
MPNHFTTSDGFRIAFHELGGPPDGFPIILQHGYTANTQSEWVSCGIADALAALGRRVIGIDALGHGASDRPHEAAHYGEARMARDVSALASHLGLKQFDLVGYSMGAVVALLCATGEPRLRRLAIGGVGEAVVLLGGVDTRSLDNNVLAEVMLADDPSSFPEGVQGFRRNAEARGNDRFALAAQARSINNRPIALDRISIPTLVLAGDADPLAIRPEVLAKAIPGARLQLVPGDHTTARTSPEFTRALVAFLG